MLYREGSLFRLRKWHIDGSWPPLGSSDRLPRVASYRMIGPPLPYNVHADVYMRSSVIFVRRLTCNFRMSRERRKSLEERLQDRVRPAVPRTRWSDNFLELRQFLSNAKNFSSVLTSANHLAARAITARDKDRANTMRNPTICRRKWASAPRGCIVFLNARIFTLAAVCVYKMYARRRTYRGFKGFCGLISRPLA